MDQIEILMHASLPPSPTSSPTHHLRLGGNNVSNLRIHRGGPSTSSPFQHSEHFSSQTMETCQRGEQQQNCNQSFDDAITSSSSSLQPIKKDEMPSTPERSSESMMPLSSSFSSPFSDDSTPTKVLDVARKNC